MLPLWFQLEGASVAGAVGFFLTGEPITGIAAGLTIVAFWFYGPSAFAKDA